MKVSPYNSNDLRNYFQLQNREILVWINKRGSQQPHGRTETDKVLSERELDDVCVESITTLVSWSLETVFLLCGCSLPCLLLFCNMSYIICLYVHNSTCCRSLRKSSLRRVRSFPSGCLLVSVIAIEESMAPLVRVEFVTTRYN